MKTKILIADDELELLEILEKKFRQNDFEVITVPNGAMVLRKCKSYLPDVIVLDILLGDADGYTIASLIRQESALAETPIIFMTGKDLDIAGIEKRLSEIGNCDFISKPCSLDELLGKVRDQIKQKK